MIVTHRRASQGLGSARLLMVFSGMSPLFLIWAIRGSAFIDDRVFLWVCGALVILPNLFLWVRFRTAKKNEERREILVGKTEDQRTHLLTYLLAMLLPFYADTLGSWRGIAATAAALGLIIFLFWHLDLHYMNFVFASRGYRVYGIVPDAGQELSGRHNLVLITRRAAIQSGTRVIALRVSDFVYFEEAP